ncbi:gamma-glutamyl-gamma-aminobutyrate hydrolase family protein [Nocardioides panacihumi]|uniref:Gamma-glutamyl-gamma-aminobutyrate hydrolase family protein n=1 Tax=Nocardioides panacihumi TaxID=400774 RepID=A0ABN2RP32_9ACTN
MTDHVPGDAAVVARAEVEPDRPLARAAGRPHVAVLVSLNFPDLTEPVAELVRRFTRNALAALTAAGASYSLVDSSLPRALDAARAARADADALLILGGGDIAAACYGGPDGPVANSYGVDEAADRGSLELIRAYVDARRPVLGICRGSQLVNVAHGGTILPDIDDHRLHRGGPGEPMFLDEKIEVLEGSRLAAIVGAGPLVVRSGHHQAVDRVGDGLVVAARALDGIVEAIEHPTRWIVGVQFHPEDDDGGDRDLGLLVGALLAAAR